MLAKLVLHGTTPVKKSENTQPGKAVDIELGFWFGSAPTGLAGLLTLRGVLQI